MINKVRDTPGTVSAATADLRLATVLSTAVDGIVTIDEYGTIQTVNRAAERLFGYAADEMIGRNVNMLMPQPYHAAHDGYLARYRETAERRIIGIGREVVGRRKDGSTFPMELAVGEAWLADGRVFTGIIRDITDRKRAESQLSAAKQMMESVVSALPVAVVAIDAAERVQVWNRAAEDILGWTAEESIGSPFPESIFADEVSGVLAARLREGAVTRGEEVLCHRKTGETIEVSLSSAPLRGDSGVLTGRICVIEDITQRKALASQLYQAQKMEAVGQLTGGLAHDFNNILGVAIGNLDLLAEDTGVQGDLLELVEAAEGALLKGADLTRQLLAFARRQPLQPERVQIEDLMAATIRMLRRTLGEQIEVSYRVAGAIWPVAVDVAQLESAITNLAINARDAMPEGGRLTIALDNVDLDEDYVVSSPDIGAGDYVLIEVSDIGHGMAPDVLEHAIEPFFTTKPPGKGTGLGLSMVYGFIKQSGGHIRIYSELGHGTTIKLYLPRAAGAGEVETVAAVAPEHVRGGSEAILVVEDNDDVRRVVVRQLRSLGYATLEAADARVAMEVLRSDVAIDLLFSDVVMPHGVSGFDLGRDAKGIRPALKVLFTSGFPSTTFASAPELTGGVQLLSKPYRKQDLARTVRAVLESRSIS